MVHLSRYNKDNGRNLESGKVEKMMYYSIRYVQGHVEVYDSRGEFVFSADTREEAMIELQQLESA